MNPFIFYVLIPLIVVIFNRSISTDLYNILDLPNDVPQKEAFPIIWTVIFIGLVYSGYIAERDTNDEEKKNNIRLFYSMQYIPIALWTYYFFGEKDASSAIVVNILNIILGVSLLHYVSHNRAAKIMVTLYIIWLCYALYTTVRIKSRNKNILK